MGLDWLDRRLGLGRLGQWDWQLDLGWLGRPLDPGWLGWLGRLGRLGRMLGLG